MKLTQKQKEIVNYIDGAVLVTAGPGSGKTRILTQRIANIVDKRKGKILALTFSNKAAEEVLERVKEEIVSEEYERIHVSTIHSFCLDIVTNKGSQIGLPNGLSIIDRKSDKLELLKKLYDTFSIELPPENTLYEIIQSIEECKRNFVSPEMIEKIEQNMYFINVYEAYNNFLISNRVIDFDDILYYAYRVLVEKPKVATNYTRLYKYILIDEAQDLNETQYKVIRALTRDFNNLMMVGDSAQSIYGFNGSDSTIMTKRFVEDYNPTQFVLTENFRSTRKIIEAATKLQPKSKFQSEYPLDGALEVYSFDNEREEAGWIVFKIEELSGKGSQWIEGEMELDNIAIIGRNRYLFSKMEEALQAKGIDYSFGSSSTNLECETTEMKIFEMGMKVLVNPFNDLPYNQVNTYLGRRGLAGDYLNDLLDRREINNLELNSKIINAIIDGWRIISENEENFSKALSHIDDSIEKETALDENFKFLIQNDVNLWKDRWQKYCRQSVGGNRSLSYFRNQVTLGKLNTDNNSGVSLLTVHMSKGLEFEIVFILGLTQGTFPDYRVKTPAQRSEELNNMFVAITRAKRECYLTYPEEKMMPWEKIVRQSPSEYLDIIRS